jgi:hypoxia up-regulated 1
MIPFFRRLAILSLFFVFLFSSTALATTVLAIDYGSDYIKASLIKPATPFDVLLDKDSKRKIRSSVAWKNGERLFGQDAFNLVRPTSEEGEGEGTHNLSN